MPIPGTVKQPIKMILLGESSSGKTGALMALAEAGYKIRIVDFDNGADIFPGLCEAGKPGSYPASALANIHYITLTETMKAAAGKVFPVRADSWAKCMDLLQGVWKEKTADEAGVEQIFDDGKVSEWGLDHVLVIDSLSRASEVAFNHLRALNGRLAADQSGNEWRRDIGAAQTNILDFLKLLTSKALKCNVIVISHIAWVDDEDSTVSPEDRAKGVKSERTGYPRAIGKAASPRVPEFFNSMLQVDVEGTGAAARRVIHTKSRGLVGAKSILPFSIPATLPLKDGLATYFKAVFGDHPKAG